MAVTQIDGSRQILDASVTNAKLAGSIALSKLAEAVIQADGGQAFTADQPMGGFKLTGLGTPAAPTDAATKAYVDAAAAGIDWKASVRAATTANGALATAYENGDAIDGVTLATGDRILLKDQSTGSENGIYTVNASGAPTRATDADSNTEVTSGMSVFVEEGTANADTGWVLTNNGAITLGTTALVFTQFTSLGQVTAGAGLTKTGSTIDAVGTANRIVVNANDIDIGTDVVTLTGSQTLTNKTLTTPTIGSFTNSAHNHTNAAGGGQITDAALSAAVGIAKGGTGQATAAAGFDALSPMTTAGDLIVGGASGTRTRLAAGATSGHVLTSTGAGSAPSWQALPGTSSFATRETPTGLVNGANTTYTLANTPTAGTEEVYLNGILQEPGAGNDYTISGATITYLTAPLTGDKIRVSYRY